MCKFKQLKRWCLQKRHPSVQEFHATKNVIKQHHIPTRENGKTIKLFFFSFVLDFIFVVMLNLSPAISRETSWTKNAVNLYVRISCLTLLGMPYFSCLALLFPTLTKFTTSFYKWYNINIYTAHMLCIGLSKNLDTNCRCIPYVFSWVLAIREWTESLQQTCIQT